MHTPPYFTQDARFLIAQINSEVFVFDMQECSIQYKTRGTIVGISKDDSVLLIQAPEPKNMISAYHLTFTQEMSLDTISPDIFTLDQRLYFSEYIDDFFESNFRRLIVFEDVFPKYNISFKLAAGVHYGEFMFQNRPIIKPLDAPIFIFSGRNDSDHGGFGCIWVGNLNTQDYIFTSIMMDNAPVSANFTPKSNFLMLIAGDGVHRIHIDSGEKVTINKPPHFDRHSNWRGKAKYIDAIAHPFNNKVVIVAEHNGWREMMPLGGTWVGDDFHTVTNEIKAIAYHPNDNQLAIITTQDLRLCDIETGVTMRKIALSE